MGIEELNAIGRDDLIKCDLSPAEALTVLGAIKKATNTCKSQEHTQIWAALTHQVLLPDHPIALHRYLYRTTYLGWDQKTLGPPPCWTPDRHAVASTNAAAFMKTFPGNPSWQERRTGDPEKDWSLLQHISFSDPEAFWPSALRALKIQFNVPPGNILNSHPSNPDLVRWLPGARLNIADCALGVSHNPALPAIIWAEEDSPNEIHTMTRAELRQEALSVALSLRASGYRPGDAIAIDMPMTPVSVVIYLGVVLSGCVVVSIADSFVASEIASRLRISGARAIFTQDVVLRGGKQLPLYSRVTEAGAPHAIVVSAGKAPTAALRVELRPGDSSWSDFLQRKGSNQGAQSTSAVDGGIYVADAMELTNILFSSGTTGEPKAIPWTHITPLRCAVDAFFHQDVRQGDAMCWPTSLGWMMGPWLVYASLLNGAAIALFNGSPLGRPFGQFITSARVALLGLVPSIVKAWRSSNCMAGLDWTSSLRCFSSTGEASAPEDYLWLSARGGYIPVIEYCGGTEIGGAYITGSMVQPQAPSVFTTPTMGACPVLLCASHHQLHQQESTNTSSFHMHTITEAPSGSIGELALKMPMLGVSQKLLNRDHAAVYYADMPAPFLRRHGDEIEVLPGGKYRACGRVDDSMNLGGIKVSSAEIERAVEGVAGVQEVAAVAVPPLGGGPERLVLFIVPTSKSGGIGKGVLTDSELKEACQNALSTRLNPLFKVYRVVLLKALPRTASNKIMRRVLRDNLIAAENKNPMSKL